MRRRIRAASVAAIDRFADWFTSAGAFAQGIVVTIIWLILVFARIADARGWWLLFAFTVFSGVTQFPLAYAARRAGEHSQKALAEIDRSTELLEQLARNEEAMLKAILALLDEKHPEESR